ncbi:hypothetical protein WJX72_011013 [[Myrmecia] bisecta]|uniref:Aminotransferase class V domain-containing protein n=1 Tax=[Myrmecia] bisecta TaxID=41462 RepID=A0AAW1PDF6_9CHLO
MGISWSCSVPQGLQHEVGDQTTKDGAFTDKLAALSEPGSRGSVADWIPDPKLATMEGSSIDQKQHSDFASLNEAALELRHSQYPELELQQHVYLDFTGGCLTSQQQVAEHLALLQSATAGNPHSASPSSELSTQWAQQARQQVLQFFNTDETQYRVVFTANASAALKLVGEGYPFCRRSTLLLCEDNHNSVNGIQCFARKRGAAVRQATLTSADLRLDAAQLLRQLRRNHRRGLFAYPAQSNVTGVKHSLGWIEVAHQHGWHVLLDAAALVPTSRLNLARHNPDFVACSFYKMFGWPTGVGCLLARPEALALLAGRPWYAGGTVEMVFPQTSRYVMHPEASNMRFEDGTINYLSLPAVTIGLKYLEGLGMEAIGGRVTCLTAWLLDQLRHLRHGNGAPLVRLPSKVRAKLTSKQALLLIQQSMKHNPDAAGVPED